jgi:rRNA maturation endonuclease Nob1
MVAEQQASGQSSWAAVAVSEPAKQSAGTTAEAVSAKPTAVIDTNAILSSVALGSLANRLVTIPEVLEEVRDVKARERLAALHVALETLEPTNEAVAAGERVAVATVR